MFGSEILEVCIGLAFVYFTISIICSGIVELGVRIFNLRARHLKAGIGQLLDDPKYSGIVAKLYAHHLISSSIKNKLGDPTTILAKDFASAMLDILGKNGNLSATQQFKAIEAEICKIKDERIKQRLLGILTSSENHLDTLRSKIGNWFDESMEQVSAWYRQRMQHFATVVAIVVVVTMNADTIRMAAMFWNDDELRQATLNAANGYTESFEARLNKTAPIKMGDTTQTAVEVEALHNNLKKIYADIQDSKPLPIGWGGEVLPGKGSSNSENAVKWWLIKLAGLFFTTGAASLGSTFWYRLLKGLLNIRFGKGNTTEKTQDTDPVPSAKTAPPMETAPEGEEPSRE